MKKTTLAIAIVSMFTGCTFPKKSENQDRSSVKSESISEIADDSQAKQIVKNTIQVNEQYLGGLFGFTGVGPGKCSEKWIDDALGLIRQDVVEDHPALGIVVQFDSNESLKAFANSAKLLGTTVSAVKHGSSKSIVVCGQVSGPVVREEPL